MLPVPRQKLAQVVQQPEVAGGAAVRGSWDHMWCWPKPEVQQPGLADRDSVDTVPELEVQNLEVAGSLLPVGVPVTAEGSGSEYLQCQQYVQLSICSHLCVLYMCGNLCATICVRSYLYVQLSGCAVSQSEVAGITCGAGQSQRYSS